MDGAERYWADVALLDWQLELGVDEATGDAPVDRYALSAASVTAATGAVQTTSPVAAAKAAAGPVPAAPGSRPAGPGTADPAPTPVDGDAIARACLDLPALKAALENLTACQLLRGARSTVFAAGDPAARVLLVTEPPTRDEDRAATPFAGAAADLLAAMFAAIGMQVPGPSGPVADPDTALYIVPAMPWRSPGDAPPAEADIALLRPFLERHIALANPDVVVLMGLVPCQMLLGQGGLTRLRGQWTEVLGRPALPMAHPHRLLRAPAAKRDAWADLLSLRARLKEMA